ncbi:MAG: hypothetical protein ABFD79_03835 [Phycisphaerales bacterium]
MMKKGSCFLICIILVQICCCGFAGNNARKLLTARTVKIDTIFKYYQDRTPESIASEIELNGFEGVYYMVIDERKVSKELVAELQSRGMPVAALFFAASIYDNNDTFPAGWQNWLVEFTTNDMKEFKFLSFVHKDYRDWMKTRIVNDFKKFGFDGFTFCEPMYAIFDGPTKTPVLYGDVSKTFQTVFMNETGNTAFPDFNDANSPNYFKKNTALYNDLVNFRIKTVNDFYGEIVNGKNGLRENFPNIIVATWSLGVDIENALEKLREWEGCDTESMVKCVRPDIHFVQTHAPDWIKPQLRGDYCKTYRDFFAAAKKAKPDVKIGVQTDVGSLPSMRRDPNWLSEFYKTCQSENVDTTTYYEFSIRWEIYSQPPVLKKKEFIKPNILKLYFDQRLAKSNKEIVAGRTIYSQTGKEYAVSDVKVDGNILYLTLNKTIEVPTKLIIPLGCICNDPSVRWPLSQLEPKPYGPVNAIAADFREEFLIQ